MKLLISGICGFVGSTLARTFLEAQSDLQIFGIDNFIRPGSETNKNELQQLGVKLFHADIRNASDLENLPAVDFVIDAAASPSVLAGVDGKMSSRQLVEHNLYGTVNMLEYCKKHRAGFILISTSRVYSIKPLAELEVEVANKAFRPKANGKHPIGLSAEGLTEQFSTASSISLYGSTKLASECLALEYGDVFNFPVWINRCGVLAGAGQFGRPDQGIFAYWVNAFLRKKPLKYIGFDGGGHQLRDCLHPKDLAGLMRKQMVDSTKDKPRIINLGGGAKNAMSLAQLSDWCAARFGAHQVSSDPTPRPFDIPWVVMDSGLAARHWNWTPAIGINSVLEEIAVHAEKNPRWLELSSQS